MPSTIFSPSNIISDIQGPKNLIVYLPILANGDAVNKDNMAKEQNKTPRNSEPVLSFIIVIEVFQAKIN
jgi:hypothetical protein